jgi:hypothetical protein
MKPRLSTFHDARGAASAEFALVLPLFLLMVMLVLALAIWAFSLALTAAGVPAGARQAGLTNSAGAGYATTRRILSVTGPAGAASGSTQIGAGAPACERGVYASLSARPGLQVPMWATFSLPLRAGSQTRNWQFYPGRPADGCE